MCPWLVSAPSGLVIYYGNVPHGRDISNLCRHNRGFYGNRRKNPSFPGSNRFSVYVARGLIPRASCRCHFCLPAPALDCYLPATAIDTMSTSCFKMAMPVDSSVISEKHHWTESQTEFAPLRLGRNNEAFQLQFAHWSTEHFYHVQAPANITPKQ